MALKFKTMNLLSPKKICAKRLEKALRIIYATSTCQNVGFSIRLNFHTDRSISLK